MFSNIPVVTKNLLILNIFVYVITMVNVSTGGHLDVYLSAHYINSPLFEPYQIVTHMFSHSTHDILHIFFNMFLLVMFGAHLERVLGAKRYFIFYIAAGIGAFVLYNSIGFIQIQQLKDNIAAAGFDIERVTYELSQMNTNEVYMSTYITPDIHDYAWLIHSQMVGASGAIFGLLAAFAMLFPNTRLMLLFPPIPIKAKYLIGAYILFEVYNSFYKTGDSIAHLAHVGGAIVGIGFVLYWRKFDKSNFY